jgi:hypothetical protein
VDHHGDMATMRTTKPLDLRWLCARHHLRYHARLRTGTVKSLDEFIEEIKAIPFEQYRPEDGPHPMRFLPCNMKAQ